MRSFDKLSEEDRLFFDKYFWAVDSRSEYGNNRASSNITVRPFLHRTKNFYWEKAYADFLGYHSEAAIVAELAMDGVYIYCLAATILLSLGTLYLGVPFEAPLRMAALILGVAWNIIDTCGAFILADKEGKNHNNWAQGINLLSGLQLLAGTIASLLLDPPKIASLGNPVSAAGLSSVIAIGATSFAFAAAMFFTWALEHREVKLHRARIDYLNIKIQALAREIFSSENGVGNYPWVKKYVDNYQGFDNYDAENEKEKITCLRTLIANAGTERSELREYKDLLKLLLFRQHQQQQLEVHERARRVWGLCAVSMTAVAIVSVVASALGLTLPFGIAVACIALLVSALYRLKEVVEATKTIKNNVHSFFKTQPLLRHHSNDVLRTRQGEHAVRSRGARERRALTGEAGNASRRQVDLREALR
ncbi:MAG: hypothetical protein RJA83_88, partial [Pseudomonadota bacterium]